MFSDGDSLSSLHLYDDSDPNPPQHTIRNLTAYALALDYQASRLYYSDLKQGLIGSILLNGSDHRIFASRKCQVIGTLESALQQI